jgi:hypothetical protein
MVKYCPICGFPGEDANKFCKRCGTNLEMSQPSEPMHNQQTDLPQQQSGQDHPGVQDQPKKSNKMIIGLVIAIIAIIIVVVILFVFVFNGGSGEFEGTWQVTSSKIDGIELGLNPTITFNPNGTLSEDLLGSSSNGSWEIKNGKLYMYSSESGSIDYSNIGLDYSFSDPDTLTITFTGELPDTDGSTHTMEIVLKRISSDIDNSNGNQDLDGETKRFLGDWDLDYGIYSGVIIFNNDGILRAGYENFTLEIGNWSLDGGKICLTITEDLFDFGITDTTQCLDYSFSEQDKNLTLSGDGFETIVMTK